MHWSLWSVMPCQKYLTVFYAKLIPVWLLWNTALSTQNMNYSLLFFYFRMFTLVTVSVFYIRVEYVSVCCDTMAMLYLKLITFYDKSLWKSYMRLLYTIVAGWKLEKVYSVNVVLLVKGVLISYLYFVFIHNAALDLRKTFSSRQFLTTIITTVDCQNQINVLALSSIWTCDWMCWDCPFIPITDGTLLNW